MTRHSPAGARDASGTYACLSPAVKCCGARHVSVTTALGVLSKPALIQWAANCAADEAQVCHDYTAPGVPHDIAWRRGTEANDELRRRITTAHARTRDKAAARGTEVHRIVEALAQGREPATIPPEVVPYLDALRRFCDEQRPIVAYSESVVSSRKGYAGTLDAIHRVSPSTRLMCPHGRHASTHRHDIAETWPAPDDLVIRDWKTRGNESKARLYGEEVLQLAAYRYATWMRSPDGAIRKMPRIDAAEVVLLWPPTGPADPGYRIERVSADREALAMFLHTLALYRYRRDQNGE